MPFLTNRKVSSMQAVYLRVESEMCNEKGEAAVVLAVIPRKGVGAHVAIISAQDVEEKIVSVQ